MMARELKRTLCQIPTQAQKRWLFWLGYINPVQYVLLARRRDIFSR